MLETSGHTFSRGNDEMQEASGIVLVVVSCG